MRITIIGAGRTGARTAAALAKEPVELGLIDRDCIEETDLKDSKTYGKKSLGALKAVELKKNIENRPETLASINATADHLGAQNITQLLGNAQLVLDCTDNWQTRALANEYSWKNRVPWVYCGALATKAMCSTIMPQEPPCWKCWNAKEPNEVLSCSTYGIDPRAADAAAAKQAQEARKIIAGEEPTLAGKLYYADCAKGIEKTLGLQANPECEVCTGNYPLLENNAMPRTVVLCGSGEWLFPNDGLQEKVRHYTPLQLAEKLASLQARAIGSTVKAKALGAQLTLLPTGRAIVKASTQDRALAANEFMTQKLLA